MKSNWYSDTAFPIDIPAHIFTCVQTTANGDVLTKVIPLKTNGDAHKGLVDLVDNDGVPEVMNTDGSNEYSGKYIAKRST